MIDYDGREVGHAKGLQRQFGLLYELSRNDRGRWDAQLFESDRITAANMMFALSAADAPRRSLFAFHFELSRTPRRKPSSFILRGAHGMTVWSTIPRGSNTCTLLLSWCIGRPLPSVRACTRRRRSGRRTLVGLRRWGAALVCSCAPIPE